MGKNTKGEYRKFSKEKNYWLEKLSGDLKQNIFPFDNINNLKKESKYDICEFTIKEELFDKIIKLSNDSNFNLYIVLVSSLILLLNKYTGEDDILLGAPILRQDFEREYINTILVYRNRVYKDMTFKDLILDVWEMATKANENMNYPIESVFESLNLEWGKPGIPFFDTVILLENIHDKNYIKHTKPHLLINFIKNKTIIEAKVEYNSLVYKKETVKRIIDNFINITKNALKDTKELLCNIEALTKSDKKILLYDFNDTKLPFEKGYSIVELFNFQAQKSPDKIALVYKDVKLTYGELNIKVNKLSLYLSTKYNIGEDDLIGLLVSPNEQMIIAILAILKIGGIFVPIEKDIPEKRIKKSIKKSNLKYVILDNDMTFEYVRCFDLSKIIEYSENEHSEFEIINNHESSVYVIYTSGTTGEPKGIEVKNSNLINYIFWFKEAANLTQKDKTVLLSSIAFDLGYTVLFTSLIFGCQLHIVDKKMYTNPKDILFYIRENQITYLKLTPSMLSTIVNSDDFNKKSFSHGLRFITVGGEKIKYNDINKINIDFPHIQIMNHYGLTECTIGSIAKIVENKEFKKANNQVVIGKPIYNTKVYILDKNHNLLPIGAYGEICIAGEGVVKGYRDNERLSKEKFLKNPFSDNSKDIMYKTGDLGKILDNGDIVYLERIDKQVKVRGYRIETGEIENYLLKNELIKEAIVVTRKDKDENLSLCAYFVSSKKIKPEDIREFLGKYLPMYMIPTYFIKIPKILLTPNGKLDLKNLPDPKIESELIISNPPKNKTERSIIEIWEETLEVSNLSVLDNFFNLGGDSIKVIKMVNKINRKLSVNIEMNDIYEYQTIRGLSDYIRNTEFKEIKSELNKGYEILEKIKNDIIQNKDKPFLNFENLEDFYPLSSIQEGMIFYSLVNPKKPIYHNRFISLAKFEKFDFGKFIKAIKILIKKHPMLRTVYNIKDFSKPIQIVFKNIEPKINFKDISDLEKTKQEEFLSEYLKKDLNNRFSFNNELLWRVKIFRLSKIKYCIVKTHHHSITDGWSSASFATEVLNTYNSLIKDEKLDIIFLKYSFRDYISLNLARKNDNNKKDFWKNYLKDYSINKLPFNYTGSKISDQNVSKMVIKDLNSQLLKELEFKAKVYKCTVKDICLAAYICLMSILTCEKDILAGVVTHNRPSFEDSEKIQGCFLNTVPIRIKLENIINKFNVLNEVKTFIIMSRKNEIFLGEIVKIVGGNKKNKNPLFDSIFNYMDFHIVNEMKNSEIVDFNDKFISDPGSENMTNTLFDLEVNRTWDKFFVHIKYSPDYFEYKNIQSAIDIYEKILKSFIKDLKNNLMSDDYILEKEKSDILNNTIMKYPMKKSIHMLFEEQVKKNPHNIALIFEKSQVTYYELNSKANKIARVLIKNNIKSNELIGISMNRGVELIASLLAVLKIGCAYVPIEKEYPIKRKEYIAKNSRLSTVLVDDESIFPVNTININEADLRRYDDNNIDFKVDSKSLAYVIYTSGSTGLPKGVMIKHLSVVNLITWINKEFDVNEKDTLLFITPISFDLSVYDVFGILSSGGKIVIASKDQVQNVKELRNLLKEKRITFWNSVPTTMSYLIKDIKESELDYLQEDLRIVFLSGDWIPINLFEKIKKYFPISKVISLGGATEGTVWSIYYPINKVKKFQTSIPYGRPIGNNFFYILDKNKEIVPYGVVGELYIGGIGVALGYMNDSKKTKNSFMPNRFLDSKTDEKIKSIFKENDLYKNEMKMIYKTGDLGRILPDGNIEFLGREDHQVKIRGFRVELGEIESKILKHTQINEAVVVDKADSSGNKSLCAYIVSEGKLKAAELREYLIESLPDYMIPNFYVNMDKLPLTDNGKIDRKNLPDPNLNIKTGNLYEAPQNEIETNIIDVWKKVLEVERISINDNFFEIGGNSLLIVQLQNIIEKLYPNTVKITDLFVYSTVRDLSGFIEKSLNKKNKIDILHMIAVEEAIKNDEDTYMGNFLSFSIKDGFYEKLKVKSENINISVDKIFLSMYIYVLSDLTLENEIIVQTLSEDTDTIYQLKVNLNNIEKFSSLLEYINNYDLDKSEVVYKIHDIDKLNIKKGISYFVPFYYIQNKLKEDKDITKIFDIILMVDKYKDEININFNYNAKLFKDYKMHELINIYQQIIESFIIED